MRVVEHCPVSKHSKEIWLWCTSKEQKQLPQPIHVTQQVFMDEQMVSIPNTTPNRVALRLMGVIT